MPTRKSPIQTLTINPEMMYVFATIAAQAIIEGQMRTVSIPAAGMSGVDTQPPLTPAQKNAIDIEFYTDATGGTTAAGTTTVGVGANTRTYSQILSVAYNQPQDEFVVTINGGGGLDIDAISYIYWALTVEQSEV